MRTVQEDIPKDWRDRFDQEIFTVNVITSLLILN